MRFTPLPLDGAWTIDLEPIHDERGSFARTWCRRALEEAGLSGALVQMSVSRNLRAGTLRGMHFQAAPHAEIKIVRCTRGAIFDVLLDLRPESDTFKRWHGVELTHENGRAVYVPEGIAHGFQTLAADTEVMYQMSEVHHPESARGVRWDDPAFGIEWPACAVRTISERDARYPDFTGGEGTA